MAEFDGYTSYWKGSMRHLRDAEELLQPPTLSPHEQGAQTRHLKGAVYLAGYGVEFILKAYIISRQPGCQTLSQAADRMRSKGRDVRDVSSALGHNLTYLLSLTDLESHMDSVRKRQMGICSKWKSSWRYDPSPMGRKDANIFLESAQSLVAWIRRLIGGGSHA